jgi:uncharacterized protein YdhG (YjbR/CyaY superfamily)
MAKGISPYVTKKYSSIEEYHHDQSIENRTLLDQLRSIIREAAPKAEEVISYNMPAFKMKSVLVYYAANKQHIGFYPTSSPIKVFADELSGYATSKGAIQFPIGKKLPASLIKKIVKFRIKEEEEKMALKKKN